MTDRYALIEQRGFLTRPRNCVRRARRKRRRGRSSFSRMLTQHLSHDVFDDFTRHIAAVWHLRATAVFAAPPDRSSRVVGRAAARRAHGDMATNAAMVLAKDAGIKPRDLAEAIAASCAADDLRRARSRSRDRASSTSRSSPAAWIGRSRAAIARRRGYGRSDVGQRRAGQRRICLRQSDRADACRPCRGAVFGDALANLLAFAGYAVTREYYINDAGAQVDVLARSAFLRYREALGEDIGAIPEGLYPGDYLKPVGAALAAEYGDELLNKPEAEWLPIVRDKAIDMMMAEIRDDLAALNVRHDVFFSERSLIEGADGDRCVEAHHRRPARQGACLRRPPAAAQGRAGRGLGRPRADAVPRDRISATTSIVRCEVRRQLHLFRLRHRLSQDRSSTAASTTMIDVWGADHGGYIKRMHAAVRAISGEEADLDVKIVQLVRLLRAGEPVKMSKRSGEFVTLREVVDEVGRDAVRFMMLYRKNDATLDFDLAKVIEQSRDNPVFYVQYAPRAGAIDFPQRAARCPGPARGTRSAGDRAV